METDLVNTLTSLGLGNGEFKDQVVVVTGAGRGIGFQAARAFAWLGAKVVIAELNPTGSYVAESIRAGGGLVTCIKTDVSDSASVANLVWETHAQFGLVDILVNNAIRCPVAKVTDMDDTLWDGVMAVNLRGTFLTCRGFLPDMLSRQHGVIINMVSADAMPGLSAYIASKQGIIGFSQSLDLEVEASNIQVVPFGPGMVDTPGIRLSAPTLAPLLGLTEDQFLHTPLHVAYDGLMPAEHAGAATVYLAARLAHEYHGQVINGYEVLEKAGLLKTSLQQELTSMPTPKVSAGSNLMELADKLETILTETEAELGNLPAFIRPMARAGFKSKSGQSLLDWQRAIAVLRSEAGSSQASSQAGLSALLGKLKVYYRDVPKETSRFTKDESFLQQVKETSLQRIDVIDQLITCLE